MSVESHMIVCKESGTSHDGWLSTVAEVDLCVCFNDPVARLVGLSHDVEKNEKAGNKARYIYSAFDGDKKVEKDCYNNKMYPIAGVVVLQALKQANKKKYYRRYDMAIGLLEAAIKGFEKHGEKIIVLFYGH